MFTEVFIFFVILLTIAVLKNRKPKNLPPGEWGLPVVGYVPFMDWKVVKSLERLREKHGKIFTVKLGSRIFVVLADFSLIKSAFQKLEMSGRPFFFHYNTLKKYSHVGVILSEGHTWMTNRRFALKTLRDFGLGKAPLLDEIIHTEASSLVEELKKSVDKPIEIDWNMNVVVLNVIWRLVANRRYDIKDEEIKHFSKINNDNLEDMDGPISLLAIFPWLIPLVPNFIKNGWMRMKEIKRRRDVILSMLKDTINEHKEKLDPSNPRDFIDKYLVEWQEQKDNPDYLHWSDDDLMLNVYDFFIAGSETTSSTLRWLFIYMMKFPEVQRKVQQQIDEVVPKGNLLSLHDKTKLPYLEALTYEVNRYSSLLPNAVPHRVTQDIVFEGYNIPKGAVVIPDIEACHKNPKYWKYPNDFSIENFLDDDGKVILNKEGYCPFSVGRRTCLGESLAKMELFMFTGVILQNFEISEPVGQNASLEPNEEVNLFNYSKKFEVILKPRY